MEPIFPLKFDPKNFGVVFIGDEELKKILPDSGIPVTNGERVWLGVDPEPIEEDSKGG
jgi:hypothetical protein